MYKKIIHDKNGERFIDYCPHCGNETPQKTLFKYTGSVDLPDVDERVNITINKYYTLAECGTCEQIILYCKYKDEDYFLGDILYPLQKNLSDSIPLEVKKAYEEALIISRLAPNAFAVQIRRALEFLCKDKKIRGRNLKEMIKNMAQHNLIPPILSEMTDGLRILGNFGAHASSIEFTNNDVVLMDDFFKAILEYVYVAPEKINKFEKRLKELKN